MTAEHCHKLSLHNGTFEPDLAEHLKGPFWEYADYGLELGQKFRLDLVFNYVIRYFSIHKLRPDIQSDQITEFFRGFADSLIRYLTRNPQITEPENQSEQHLSAVTYISTLLSNAYEHYEGQNSLKDDGQGSVFRKGYQLNFESGQKWIIPTLNKHFSHHPFQRPDLSLEEQQAALLGYGAGLLAHIEFCSIDTQFAPNPNTFADLTTIAQKIVEISKT